MYQNEYNKYSLLMYSIVRFSFCFNFWFVIKICRKLYNFIHYICLKKSLYDYVYFLYSSFIIFSICCSQRALAEVTEMIRTSHLVHKGLVNIYPGLYSDPSVLNDMMFGNKIALLGGDYLLGNCCAELAALRNQDVSLHHIIDINRFQYVINVSLVKMFYFEVVI